jgi:cell division septum initiation protein DivIVA
MTGMMDGLTDRMRSRMTEARLGNLDRDNVRLRGEIAVLHSELDHERSEREEMRDLLRSRPKTVKVRGRRPILRVLVIGAGAYLLGARAGRERYDEIVERARLLRDRLKGRADDAADQVADRVQATAADMRAQAGELGEKVRERTDDVVDRVHEKATQAGDRVDLTRSELQTRP